MIFKIDRFVQAITFFIYKPFVTLPFLFQVSRLRRDIQFKSFQDIDTVLDRIRPLYCRRYEDPGTLQFLDGFRLGRIRNNFAA